MAPLLTLRHARPLAARQLLALAAVGALATAGACTDNSSLQPSATAEVSAATPVVAALTGTGPNSRSAIVLRGTPTAVIPEGAPGGNFHVVLDINAQGQPVVYPASLVSSVADRRAAIRRVETSYDSLTRAPTSGYSSDSALTVAVGEVVGVQLADAQRECSQFVARPYFYSKLVVDSVRLADRLLFVRATTNPNCGFRSFAPGVPRD